MVNSRPKSPSKDATHEANFFERISSRINHAFESMFFKLGFLVASHPIRTICLCLLVTGLCGVGFLNWSVESRANKLWIPQDSIAIEHDEIVSGSFDRAPRIETIIALADNGDILTETNLQTAWKLYKGIAETKSGGQSFTQLCLRGAGDRCTQTTIFDVWSYNATVIEALTQSDIDTDIKQATSFTTATGSPLDIEGVLGGIQRASDTGFMTRAKAVRFSMFLTNRNELVDGRDVDNVGDAWEDEVLKNIIEPNAYSGLEINAQLQRSFGDEFGRAIQGDISLFLAGYVLIIIYSCLMLGKRDRVHSRAVLACLGIASVGMSIAASFGLCGAFGVFYGPVHSVLPFLLLGVGVDDMFIIVNSMHLTYQTHPDPKMPLNTRVAHAVSHAGMSITITSITDFLAFMIGASTVLPALSSFCIFAGLGILLDFAFQITFFVACMTLDTRRADRNRFDCSCCCFPCCPSKCSRQISDNDVARDDEQERRQALAADGAVARFLGTKVGPFITHKRVIPAIIVVFAGLFGFGIYGATQLKQDFSFSFFIPTDSYLLEFEDWNEEYFTNGYSASAVTTELAGGYASQQTRLDTLDSTLKASPYLDAADMRSWYASYKLWAVDQPAINTTLNSDGHFPTSDAFLTNLDTYLTTSGSRFAKDVKWVNDKDVKQGIRVARISLRIKQSAADTSADQVTTMNGMRDEVSDIGLGNDNQAFPFSFQFLFWEQYAVIEEELVRNLGLAFLAVVVVVGLFVGHPTTAFTIAFCIIAVVVETLGFMWAWDLAIDSVAVVNLVLAIGLAVDYSAHIGHCFMTVAGSRRERAAESLRKIGGSVLNGAISTFLAVLVLAFSKSFVFKVFFKIFFLVAVLGVSHGIILLPALLSLWGPKPYANTAVAHSEPDIEKAVELVVPAAGDTRQRKSEAGHV